jgi:hypothetical protein
MNKIDRLHEIAFELEAESLSQLPASPAAQLSFRTDDSRSPSEMKISYPFEQSLTKERCNLCRLYFARDSVTYKVPVHRIMELKKLWKDGGSSKEKENYEGRRYNFPSYLYTTSSVCIFCSQFFSTMPNERQSSPAKADLAVLPSKEKGLKLEINSTLNRTDVSQSKKAYQSSEVDYKYAIYAVTPPFDQCTRSKREVDPWWEINLGWKYNIEEINFSLLIGIRQYIEIFIFLLDKPIGFENPFLDSMIEKNVITYKTAFKGKDKPEIQNITWKLPENSFCYAIRIQLKGIQILSISNFHAIQGNDFPSFAASQTTIEEQEMLALSDAFASLKPEVVQETFKEKQMIELKGLIESGEYADLVNNQSSSLSHNHLFDAVDAVKDLKSLIHQRYDRISEWKSRVLTAASIFSSEEIFSLFKVIFRYSSDLYPFNKENNLSDHDLLGTGITLHYPRCDLMELHSRIRSVLYWIQTRSHLKTLGPLLNTAVLINLANNSHEPLFRLTTVFKKMEYYWTKKEEKELAFIEEQSSHPVNPLLSCMMNSSTSPGKGGGGNTHTLHQQRPEGLVVPKASEYRGCSWSQFLIIMNLFVTNQCDLIPYQAFNIDHPKPNAPIVELGSYSYQSGDAMSTSSFSVSLQADGSVIGRGGNKQHYSFHHNRSKIKSSHASYRPNNSSISLSLDGGIIGGRKKNKNYKSLADLSSINRLDQGSFSSLFSPTESMLIIPATTEELRPKTSLFHTAK